MPLSDQEVPSLNAEFDFTSFLFYSSDMIKEDMSFLFEEDMKTPNLPTSPMHKDKEAFSFDDLNLECTIKDVTSTKSKLYPTDNTRIVPTVYAEMAGAEDILVGVQHAAKKLKLSTNPMLWNVEQVQVWINYVQIEHALPEIQLDVLDGAQLCSMTLAEWKKKTVAADVLFAELQVWKNAFQYDQQEVQQKSETSSISSETSPVTGLLQPEWEYRTRERDGSFSSQQSYSSYSSCDEEIFTNPEFFERNFFDNATSKDNSSSVESSTSLSGVTLKTDNGLTIPAPVFTTPVSQLVLPDTACLSKNFTLLDGVALKPRRTVERDPLTCDIDRPIHLWEFLLELLEHPKLYGSYIRWIERGAGIFKIEDSVQVAKLWGRRKNRPAMNYDKLSRSVRQYYKKGIIMKTGDSKRLIYKFGSRYIPK